MKTAIVCLLWFLSGAGGTLIGEKLFGKDGATLGLLIGILLPFAVIKIMDDDLKKEDKIH